MTVQVSKAEPVRWISGDVKYKCLGKFWLSSYSTHKALLPLHFNSFHTRVLGPSLSYRTFLTHFYICSFEMSYCLLFYFAKIACLYHPLIHFCPTLYLLFLALTSAVEILCLVFEVNKICLSLRILHYLVSSYFYLFITGYRLHLYFLFIYCIRWRDQRRKQAVDP